MDDQRLRVLIVDDTVVYRRILSDVVESMDEAGLSDERVPLELLGDRIVERVCRWRGAR